MGRCCASNCAGCGEPVSWPLLAGACAPSDCAAVRLTVSRPRNATNAAGTEPLNMGASINSACDCSISIERWSWLLTPNAPVQHGGHTEGMRAVERCERRGNAVCRALCSKLSRTPVIVPDAMRVTACIGLNATDDGLFRRSIRAKQIRGAVRIFNSHPDGLLCMQAERAFKEIAVRVDAGSDGVIAAPDCDCVEIVLA